MSVSNSETTVTHQPQLANLQQLKQQFFEDNFEAFLGEAPQGVCLVDADLRIIHCNKQARRTFRVDSDLIGNDLLRALTSVFHGTSAQAIAENTRQTIHTGEPCDLAKVILQRIDQPNKRYFNWRITRVPQPHGEFGALCYFSEITEQVLAQSQAERAGGHFRAFVTASSDAVYRVSADWSEMRHLQGRDFIADMESPSESWIDRYIHPDDRHRVALAIRQAIETESVFELEHRVIRVDGTIGWTHSRAIAIRNEEGAITEWLGAARDVTARKLAENELLRLKTQSDQQRRLYQTILGTTPDLIYVFDLSHRFCYANHALLTMWGKTWDEAIGKTCLELGYEAWHAEMHRREIEQVVATKRPIRGEVPFNGTHGRRIYDYIFVPVFGLNGEVEAVAGTTRDVTERKLAEEKVQRSEERLRFMAESMPQKIFTALPSGVVDYFNRQWTDFAGPSIETVSHWTQLLHADDVTEHAAAWKQSMETGETLQQIQRLRRSDGTYRWHLTRANALRDPDGEVTMWIGSSTEIHEQKTVEEQLRDANRGLEEFAYVASHDLQEPLRMVAIYTQLLLKEFVPNDERARKYARFISQGAHRMEELIRDLLSYSRAAHIETLAEATANLSDALSLALDTLQTSLELSGGSVAAEPLPLVRGSTERLAHVFQNLVSNSLKYRRTDVAPEVTITARNAGDHWVISVADNGIGFEPAYAERIFGLFKRLHSHQYEGTGLGLAICKRIIERSGGTIWAEGKPDRGATFYLSLPAVGSEIVSS